MAWQFDSEFHTMRYLITALTMFLACLAGGSILRATPQFESHSPDDHTLLLYNRGGVEANADGLPHQQLGLGLGLVRGGRWHNLASTFD